MKIVILIFRVHCGGTAGTYQIFKDFMKILIDITIYSVILFAHTQYVRLFLSLAISCFFPG